MTTDGPLSAERVREVGRAGYGSFHGIRVEPQLQATIPTELPASSYFRSGAEGRRGLIGRLEAQNLILPQSFISGPPP